MAPCILPHFSPTRRAMLRPQSGPVAGIPFSTTPSSCLTRLEPALFQVLLQRRLSLPLLLTKHFCWCGRQLDAFGHHRAACSRSGVLGRRGFSMESAAARVCREAGGRVATNLFVPTTTDVWRWWPTVCHSLVACSLLWTPLWCLQFKAMGNRRGELLTGMVWHSNGLARGKKQHTLNSCSQVAGRAWWFWLWRWGAVGHTKPGLSCSCSHQVGAASDEAACGTGMASSLVLSPEEWGPNLEKWGPERVGPRRVEGPKFHAFSSLSRLR